MFCTQSCKARPDTWNHGNLPSAKVAKSCKDAQFWSISLRKRVTVDGSATCCYSWETELVGRAKKGAMPTAPSVPRRSRESELHTRWRPQSKGFNSWDKCCRIWARKYPSDGFNCYLFFVIFRDLFWAENLPRKAAFGQTAALLHFNGLGIPGAVGYTALTCGLHRFSAFWLRSKCSICSYQLNIWYEDHVSSSILNWFLKGDGTSGACSGSITSWPCIAVPQGSAHFPN